MPDGIRVTEKKLEIISIVLFFIAWKIITSLGIFPPLLLPPPEVAIANFIDMLLSGELLTHILVSLRRVFTAFLLAAVLGIPWGIAAGRSDVFRGLSGWYVRAMLCLGGIAWIPLSILWFGLSETARVFVILMGSLPPVVMNTMEGFRNINPNYIKAAKTLGAKPIEIFRTVVLPSSLPYILSGLRLSMGFGFRVMIAAELIAASAGLGYLLESARAIGKTQEVIMVMLTIVGLEMLIEDLGFKNLEKKLLKWRPEVRV